MSNSSRVERHPQEFHNSGKGNKIQLTEQGLEELEYIEDVQWGRVRVGGFALQLSSSCRPTTPKTWTVYGTQNIGAQ
jgi:hypothetical protein